MTCFLFQSVLVTLLAVALAMYLTRKSLKQGTSPPPASAPPAPSTPAPAKQPEEVTVFNTSMDFFDTFQTVENFEEMSKKDFNILIAMFRLEAPTSGRRTKVQFMEAQFSGIT